MLTPKCRPRDFRVSARENSTKNRLYRFKWNLTGRNLAGFREEFASLDKQNFSISMTYSGCAGSLKPTRLSLQFGEWHGDLAKLQGQCRHIPAEDRLHLSGLDGFLPNSRSRETIILSREGRIRITVPVFFEIWRNPSWSRDGEVLDAPRPPKTLVHVSSASKMIIKGVIGLATPERSAPCSTHHDRTNQNANPGETVRSFSAHWRRDRSANPFPLV